MIFTTNKPLAAWGLVLHDPDLAEAILDRVLERGRILELRGESYRTRHLRRQQPERSPEKRGHNFRKTGAIFSGTHSDHRAPDGQHVPPVQHYERRRHAKGNSDDTDAPRDGVNSTSP
jgi:hypothetical protein